MREEPGLRTSLPADRSSCPPEIRAMQAAASQPRNGSFGLQEGMPILRLKTVPIGLVRGCARKASAPLTNHNREAAAECSPGREPWEEDRKNFESRRDDRFVAAICRPS